MHGLLEMFGAFFIPGNAVNYLAPGDYVAAPPLSGIAEAVAVTRLACVAVTAAAAAVTAGRFVRPGADLVNQLLLAGIVANLAAYIPSSLADHTALNAREFAPVLPFAAVLAARTLIDPLAAWLPALRGPARQGPLRRGRGLVAAALTALLCWYGFGLWHETQIPAAPDPYPKLEAFLVAHHLHSGVGGYWDASVITVGTGGAVTVRAVTGRASHPAGYDWESKASAWYDSGQAARYLRAQLGRGQAFTAAGSPRPPRCAGSAACARRRARRCSIRVRATRCTSTRGMCWPRRRRWHAADQRRAQQRPRKLNVCCRSRQARSAVRDWG